MWELNGVTSIGYRRDYIYHVVFDNGTETDVDFLRVPWLRAGLRAAEGIVLFQAGAHSRRHDRLAQRGGHRPGDAVREGRKRQQRARADRLRAGRVAASIAAFAEA